MAEAMSCDVLTSNIVFMICVTVVVVTAIVGLVIRGRRRD